jgi:hypothetical protein
MRETEERLCDEANRLLGVWSDLSVRGGRFSTEAGTLYRDRIKPLLKVITNQDWDWANETRWPALVKAIDVMTRPE